MRAKAVRGALATALEARLRGVTSRIEIVPESRGELQPVTTDKSAAGRELNRRVEVFVSLNSPAPLPTKPKVPRVPYHGRLRSAPTTPGRRSSAAVGHRQDHQHEGPEATAEVRQAVRPRGEVPPAAARRGPGSVADPGAVPRSDPQARGEARRGSARRPDRPRPRGDGNSRAASRRPPGG